MAARAKVIARAMVANGGECAVEEDDEKITLSFRCGSGGKLIDDGRYEGELKTLSVRAEIAIVPVGDKSSPTQPDYRVLSQGIEIGGVCPVEPPFVDAVEASPVPEAARAGLERAVIAQPDAAERRRDDRVEVDEAGVVRRRPAPTGRDRRVVLAVRGVRRRRVRRRSEQHDRDPRSVGPHPGHDPRGLPAGTFGRRRDRRSDVRADGPLVGHPEDRAVGLLAGDAEQPRRECRPR